MVKRYWSIILSFMLTLSLIVPFSQSTQAAEQGIAKIGPVLEEKLLSATEALNVIVTFKGDGPLKDDQLGLLTELGITKGLYMESLPMAGIVATPDQIKNLANNESVYSIYLNRKLEYFNFDATALTGVDKVRTDDNFRKANGGLPVTGEGVGVVVNDSGVDGTHKDIEYGDHLVQNVMGNTNLNAVSSLLPISYVENIPNTDTNSGHGTHVAGTVGGTGEMSGGKYEGVAPGADLIGYGSGAALFILDSIGGFDYAITHQSEYNIRVITNSWGTSGDFDPYDPVNIASKKAYDRGITVLFAAGNEGPSENTHNPYAKAPWVISVAAGEKDGTLADFSSRGTKDVGGTFTMDGKTWTWEDRPTVTAPGVNIISTRVLAPVSSLGATTDVETIETAYLPYYTTMSGTSMATPHVAGIVALMLEANPLLSPDEVKEILQKTATNMSGYEDWEVGAGYVNAYAAVDYAFNGTEYGDTVNLYKSFNSTVESSDKRIDFKVDYNPITLVSDNAYTFQVEKGVNTLVAKIYAYGLLEQTGNPVNLVLTAPDGTEYSSGISLLFALYPNATVSVNAPMSGTWKAEVRGLRGDEANPLSGAALPETISGTISLKSVGGFSGLNDIGGHPAEAAIKMAVNEHLVDGYSNGSFQPDRELTRRELAQFLVMGTGIRQSNPGVELFKDVAAADTPYVNAVVAKGAALRDGVQLGNGVMLVSGDSFKPKANVTRLDLAYSLVQSLGLQSEAEAKTADKITVQYGDERIPVEDVKDVPESLKGYVQLALDLNILNAYFTVEQGPYDLKPTVHATFAPTKTITRGDYAVAVSRFYEAYLK